MEFVPLINPFNGMPLQKDNETLVDEQNYRFPIVNGVPRFVPNDNYTTNFGFQWNKFQKTQIDRESRNSSQSKERFFAVTDWGKEDLSGKNILEAGSGAGRFTQIVLDYTKANLYSFDYSDAVSANFRNNGHHGDRLKLFQASIYDMPFPNHSFDKVFCFGVLQHTPDFEKSVKCLIDKVKSGGELIVDFYPVVGWWTKIHAKYILRPWTKKMSHEKLLGLIDRNADWLINTTNFFNKVGLGKITNRFLPVCDIKGTLPPNLAKEELREWVVLDTFDMYSPEHDHPQRIETVKGWFEKYGMKVTHANFITYGDNFKAAVVKGIKN
ncbi:MAG: class I SAM-dependent methyltransferase [Gammaproteobacteria bacterium]|nr:MAG: class I SAM-dependent methyltransferase [Gammaproteobacteria bacterium]